MSQIDRWYQALFKHSTEGVWVFDPDSGQALDANPHFLSLLGHAAADLPQLNLSHLIHESDGRFSSDLQALMASGKAVTGAHGYRRKDGMRLDVEARLTLVDFDGKPAILSIVRDLTSRKQQEEALFESEQLSQALFESSSIGIALINLEGQMIETNRALQRMLGYESHELYNIALNAITFNEDQGADRELFKDLIEGARESYHLERRYHRKDGSLVWGRLTVSMILDTQGQARFAVGMIENLTERKWAEEALQHYAYSDPLTNLPNRLWFHDRLIHALSIAQRQERKVAVIFLDLDRFKMINDTLGHDIGDLLLKAIADRLIECVGPNDNVSRLGGDEFTIILSSIRDEHEASGVAEKILAELTRGFEVAGQELFINASIGISLYPGDGMDATTLLRNADVAMYRAKEQGNHYQLYAPIMHEAASEQLLLENHLHKALARGEFLLHYQPQVSLKTGRIVGAEALIRWHHPEFGLISPLKFIPLAEETGLIVPISEWVLKTACAQAQRWQGAGGGAFRISVNLSARLFRQKNLLHMITETLEGTGLNPAYLDLELTESILMENMENSIATLNNLHGMGIQLSIDDFGTGYSSLNYLKRFPIHTLKIDQSFVRDLTSDQDDAAIVKAIIALAHSMNLKVTAEGVETEGQLAFLHAQECDEIQGYYFSRPLTVEAFTQLIESENAVLKLPSVSFNSLATDAI